jgi:hypothetical protein
MSRLGWFPRRGVVVATLIAAALPVAARTSHAQDARPAPAPPQADDVREALREAFRVGLERYVAQDYTGALAVWEPIYVRLGPRDGYRLAFNLARANDKLGRRAACATHLADYLGEVRRRREGGEVLEASVTRQADEAEERLRELAPLLTLIRVRASVGRFRFDDSTWRAPPNALYLEPGTYAVQVDGHPSVVPAEVRAFAGATLDLDIRDRVASPPASPPTAVTNDGLASARPFHPGVLVASGVVTALGVTATAFTYQGALGTREDYFAAGDATRDRLRSDYESQRTTAYVALGATLVSVVALATLTTWYLVAPSGKPETKSKTSAGRRWAPPWLFSF